MKSKSRIDGFRVLLSSLCLIALLFGGSPAIPALAEAEVDLWIGLKAPQHVAPGSETLINLSYVNLGAVASPEIEILVTLPTGTSFLSAVDKYGDPLPPATVEGNSLTWVVDGLPADSAWQHIWMTVAVAGDLPEETELVTTAVISSGATESILENNKASVTSVVCDMARSKKQANVREAKPLDIVTFTVTLEMTPDLQPQVRERNVTLTDFLPPPTQAKFMGWDIQPPGATFDEQQRQLRWQGTLSENAPVLLRYRLGIVEGYPLGEPLQNQTRLQWSEGGKQFGMDLESVAGRDDRE